MLQLGNAELKNATLSHVQLEYCHLAGVNLENNATLISAHLEGANLLNANLKNATLHNAHLQRATLENTHLEKADFGGAHLDGARLDGAHLENADLGDTNLENANLSGAYLDNTGFAGARFKKTNLTGLVYSDEHRPFDDGTERVRPCARDRLVNWSRLRQIGALPLFGVSYFALALAIAVANSVGLLNTYLPDSIEGLVALGERAGWLDVGFKAPDVGEVLVPRRMSLILVSSLLLVIGTTLYRFACPQRIQDFSETQWVEEHGRPRLQYFAASWSRRWLQWPTLICTGVGGGLALYLLGEKLWEAIWNVAKYGELG